MHFDQMHRRPAGPMLRMGAPSWQHVWRGAMPGVRRLASTGRRPDVTRDQPRAPPGHRPQPRPARRPAGSPLSTSICSIPSAHSSALSCCYQLNYCSLPLRGDRSGDPAPGRGVSVRGAYAAVLYCAGAHGTDDGSIWRRSVT